MPNLVIKHSSHSLTNFTICEQQHAFVDLLSLKSPNEKPWFKRGTLVSRILCNYYYRKIKHKDFQPVVDPLFLFNIAVKKLNYSREEARDFMKIMIHYFSAYENETWIPLAVEKRFAIKIYENDKYTFIYEGQMDLVVSQDNAVVIVDHKTQSRKYDIYPFNHQVMGYLYATKASQFVYNYIKFTKEDSLRRVPVIFTQAQLDRWKDDTIEQFFRTAHAYEKKSFLRSWNCSTKYGVCDFHNVCEATSYNQQKWLLDTQFVKMKRRYI